MAPRSASARPALGSVFMMSKVEVVVRRVAASESTDQCEDEERNSHHHLTWVAEPVARLACLHREVDRHGAPGLPPRTAAGPVLFAAPVPAPPARPRCERPP